MSDPILSGGPTYLIPQEARPDATRRTMAQTTATQSYGDHGGARGAANRDSRAWRSAVEFEAVFLSQMLEHMFTETEAEAPFGGGSAEQTWKSLMNQEYGRSIARAGGIGIASHVYREMMRLQEA